MELDDYISKVGNLRGSKARKSTGCSHY